jgi:hypothetical protein
MRRPFFIPAKVFPMPATVRAWIDLRRIREMTDAGWRLCGPTAETCVLMEGPDPDHSGGWRQIGATLRILEDIG